MRLSRWSLLLFITGVLAPLAWAGTREDLAEWAGLSTNQQRQISSFVRDWRSLDAETRNRLQRVMVRYSDWLSRLTSEERSSIDRLPTLEEKVKRIRQLRDQQWLARLPKADRDKADTVKTDAERQKIIAELRAKECRRELAWQLSLIRNEDQSAVLEQVRKLAQDLRPKLRPEDQQRLNKAGKEEHLKTLVELAQKYKVALPPLVERRYHLLTIYPRIDNDKIEELVQKLEDESARKHYAECLHGNDPVEREQAILELTHLYWETHPQMLKRIREREADEQRKRQKQMGK